MFLRTVSVLNHKYCQAPATPIEINYKLIFCSSFIPVLQGKTQIHELNKAVKTTNSNLLFPILDTSSTSRKLSPAKPYGVSSVSV